MLAAVRPWRISRTVVISEEAIDRSRCAASAGSDRDFQQPADRRRSRRARRRSPRTSRPQPACSTVAEQAERRANRGRRSAPGPHSVSGPGAEAERHRPARERRRRRRRPAARCCHPSRLTVKVSRPSQQVGQIGVLVDEPDDIRPAHRRRPRTTTWSSRPAVSPAGGPDAHRGRHPATEPADRIARSGPVNGCSLVDGHPQVVPVGGAPRGEAPQEAHGEPRPSRSGERSSVLRVPADGRR